MTNTHRRRVMSVTVALGMLTLAACGGSPGSGGDPSRSERGATAANDASGGGASRGGSSSDARATGSAEGIRYAPNVTVMEEEDGLRQLAGVSFNGALLLFEGGDSKLAALKPGDVILIKNILARKVVLVEEESDGMLAVLTEPAGLTDVITDGHLKFSYPLRFTDAGVVNTAALPASAGASAPWFGRLVQEAYAAPPPEPSMGGGPLVIPVEFEYRGWTFKLTITPTSNRLGIKARASREGSGFKAAVAGEGYLQDFDVAGGLDVVDGTLDQLELIDRNMNGMMNFTWSVKLDVPERPFQTVKVEFPVSLNVPLGPLVGGMPLFLVLDGAMQIKPGFGGKGEISYGEFRVLYNGTQRFTVKQGNVDPEGNVVGTGKLLNWGNLSRTAPVGLVVAFALPRVELVFGLHKGLPMLKDMEDRFGKAAKRADQLFDILGRRAFGDEAMDKMADVRITKAIEIVQNTEASAWFDIVTSVGTSAGTLSFGECQQTDTYITANVGVSAKLMGMVSGSKHEELWKKHNVAVRPPGRLCTYATEQ